jgi:hypothetical protein
VRRVVVNEFGDR